MIPPEIAEFVHGPQVMMVGTRDQALRPTVRRVAGALAGPEPDIITIFLADRVSQKTMENLRSNGRVALMVVDGFSHRTYQFKGAFRSAWPSTAADKAVRDLYIEKLAAHYRGWFVPIPDAFWKGLILDPSTSVSFRVEAVFDQTPGPNAGRPVPFTPSA